MQSAKAVLQQRDGGCGCVFSVCGGFLGRV